MPISQIPALPSSNQYIAPPFNADDKDKVAWVDRALGQGESFIRSNRAFEDIDRAIELIAGNVPKRPAKLCRRTFLLLVIYETGNSAGIR